MTDANTMLRRAILRAHERTNAPAALEVSADAGGRWRAVLSCGAAVGETPEAAVAALAALLQQRLASDIDHDAASDADLASALSAARR